MNTVYIARLMRIKAITLFRLRAVSDFVFIFCSLINIKKKLQSVTETKYWHTIFSQLFSFTLRYKLCLSEYSPSRPFLHALCVFDRLDAPEAQSVLCLSVLERAAHARTHTHTHARANTHTSAWGTASLVWIVLSTFYYQTCPAI